MTMRVFASCYPNRAGVIQMSHSLIHLCQPLEYAQKKPPRKNTWKAYVESFRVRRSGFIYWRQSGYALVSSVACGSCLRNEPGTLNPLSSETVVGLRLYVRHLIQKRPKLFQVTRHQALLQHLRGS